MKLIATYTHPNQSGAVVEVHRTDGKRSRWVVIERDRMGFERVRKTPLYLGVVTDPETGEFLVSGEYRDGYEVYGRYATAAEAKATLKGAT